MNKQEIRQEVRRRFAQTSAEERRMWSEELCESLLSDPKLQSAQTIMAFSPMKDEVDITPALDAFAKQGKTILLPLVTSPTEMVPINMAQSVRANEVSLEKIDAVIVPGMAFTRQGVRLGRGRGYYDRFLPLIPRAYLRGVCFPYQIFEEIPHEEHDILVPIALSECANECSLKEQNKNNPRCPQEEKATGGSASTLEHLKGAVKVYV